MNLDEFRVEESPTDLDGARNVCVTLDHVGDHNEIPILNVSTDDVSGNTLEHFYEYLWVNSGYAPFYGARYGDDFKSSASAPRNGALL